MVGCLDVGDFCFTVFIVDEAFIGNLTAGESIEVSLFKADISFILDGIDFDTINE